MQIIQNQTLNHTYTNQNLTFRITTDTNEYTKQLPKDDKSPFPLFSYSLPTDRYKNNPKAIINNVKGISKAMAKETKLKQKNYLSGMIVKSKDGFKQINYDDMIKRTINEDINFKNSFIEYSYENIENCSPVFTTITLDAPYHVEVKRKINSRFEGLGGKELLEEVYKMHLEGYNIIKSFRRTLYKNRIFKTGKLDKLNRSSISAIEPHKDWAPHEHQLHFLNSEYINEFIETFIRTATNLKLGRTQIVLIKKDLDILLDTYKVTIKYSKGSKNKTVTEYHIDGTNVFLQEFEITNGDELKSVSNYLSSYIETKHLTFDDTQDKGKKKQVLEYEGYAHYIAYLKDLFESKGLYGKTHRKIRRISYTQQLISRSVYKRIMTQDFVNYLTSINEFKEKNMYYNVTKMLQDGKLTVFKYIERFALGEIHNKDQDVYYEYPKFEKNNVNFYNVTYGNYTELIDCKSFDVYTVDSETGVTTLKHQSKQIDLGVDDFVVIEYKLKRNGNKFISDLF